MAAPSVSSQFNYVTRGGNSIKLIGREQHWRTEQQHLRLLFAIAKVCVVTRTTSDRHVRCFSVVVVHLGCPPLLLLIIRHLPPLPVFSPPSRRRRRRLISSSSRRHDDASSTSSSGRGGGTTGGGRSPPPPRVSRRLVSSPFAWTQDLSKRTTPRRRTTASPRRAGPGEGTPRGGGEQAASRRQTCG